MDGNLKSCLNAFIDMLYKPRNSQWEVILLPEIQKLITAFLSKYRFNLKGF